jgi:hypothetical protein
VAPVVEAAGQEARVVVEADVEPHEAERGRRGPGADRSAAQAGQGDEGERLLHDAPGLGREARQGEHEELVAGEHPRQEPEEAGGGLARGQDEGQHEDR